MLAIALTLLLSCAENNNTAENTTADPTANYQENEDFSDVITEAGRILPNLPEMDFGGYVFTYLTPIYNNLDWVNPTPIEIIAEEEDGEPVNDAVFRRNLVIKERFNIDIRMLSNLDERATLRRAVQAGDDIYDAVIMFNNNVPGIVADNVLLNIADLIYIDTEKPWWDDAVNSLSIMNQNYFLAGDILILDNKATNALLFNKRLMTDLGFDLPYDLVREGKWTMDVLYGFVSQASRDLNGDGLLDGRSTPHDDQFGFLTMNDALHAFLVGGGGALALKDENDIPFMTVTAPRNIEIFERAMDFFNPLYTVNIQNMTVPYDNTYHRNFEEGRTLFMWARMRVVEMFRGMEDDFGIVPLPKFDEQQESYHSAVNNFTGVLLGVPLISSDPDRTSIILEALAAESRYTLQPAYYDIALTRKYARDEESEEMLDIIFSTRVYDIGAVYSFGDIFLNYIMLARTGQRNLTSFYERHSARMQRDIDRIIDIFHDR